MSSKETWKWTKYSPEKFTLLFREVPVRSGKISNDKRKCYLLGTVGTLSDKPYTQESFFRIVRGEKGHGLFFVEKMIKCENGSIRFIIEYTKFSMLPNEIKSKITVIKEGTKFMRIHRERPVN